MGKIKIALAFITVISFLIGAFLPAGASGNGSVYSDTGPQLNGTVTVNGEAVEAPRPYVYDGDGRVVMVPLRAIAEKLGLDVVWNEDDRSVGIGPEIRIIINEEYFLWRELRRIELNPAPELTDVFTYVPLAFFEYAVMGFETGIAGGSVFVNKDGSAVIWCEPDNSVYSVYADADSDEYQLPDSDNYMRVGKTSAGGDVFSFLRLPLGSDFFPDEIAYAKLYLKIARGTPPSTVRIGAVNRNWLETELTAGQAKALLRDGQLTEAAADVEGNGWISIAVTDIVRSWLCGDIPNAGFALFGTDGEETGVFIADDVCGYASVPYIKVGGTAGERPRDSGKFGYTAQPEEGLANSFGGNCLAYALRDKNPILLGDLAPFGESAEELNTLLSETNADTLADHIAASVEKYVEAHKERLAISGFRRLDSYDSPIDAAEEYRVALRTGGFAVPEIIMGRLGFDFHFWAQLDDGRWTQKFPQDISEIIPGSAPGVSPEKYGWNSARMWNSKYIGFYGSSAVYFAVTKNTDEFTSHKQ